MSKQLVIVESPAKAKTISRFLGENYTVRASMGHVADLPEHDLGVDVENKYQPSYLISEGKKKVVDELKKLAKESEKVWIATDEDREGEAIGWHIMNALKLKDSQYDRIVFHEITQTAINKAIETPRKINQFLVDAQQARRVIDRLVGYKLSPLLWRKVQKGLSAGRVQSVAVRILVDREEEIRAFKIEENWRLKGVGQPEKGRSFNMILEKIAGKKVNWTNKDHVIAALEKGLGEINTTETKTKKDWIELLIEKTPLPTLTVLSVAKKTTKKSPVPPFTTSTLQQEGHRKFGYAVDHTMRLAQQLYEGVDLKRGRVALITYMRTDSVNLSEEALSQIKSYVGTAYGKDYCVEGYRRYKTNSKGAQEAHEAIRPVDITITPDSLQGELPDQLLRLYTLIWKRTVATQMADVILENTDVKLELPSAHFLFGAKGQVIRFDGFMKLYTEDSDEEDDEEGEAILPAMEEGDSISLLALKAQQLFTKPPSRYTEATLVKKMESEGIGRPSTYAPTIKVITDRGYLKKEKKFLVPTDIAFVVTNFLKEHFADVVDYKFTARIEERFDEVSEGKEEWTLVVDDFYLPFIERIDHTAKTARKYAEETSEICPDCGKPLVIRMSKYGKFMSCSGFPECRYTKNMDGDAPREKPELELLDELCPDCGKPLAKRTGRFGPFTACSDYPACKYIQRKSVIVKEKGCPDCGGNIVEKRSKRGKVFFGCDQYPKCKYAVWNKEDIKD